MRWGSTQERLVKKSKFNNIGSLNCDCARLSWKSSSSPPPLSPPPSTPCWTRREGRWEEARDPSPPFWWGPGEAVAAMGWDAQGPQWQRQTKIWMETLTFTLPWGQKPGVLTDSISNFSRIFQLFFKLTKSTKTGHVRCSLLFRRGQGRQDH